MTKKHIIISIIIILFTLFLWIGLGVIVHDYVLPKDYFYEREVLDVGAKSYIDYLNVLYVALGALGTGLAFAITFFHLLQQSKALQIQNQNLSQQISSDVFTDAFGHVLDSNRFLEAQKYIFSYQFLEDVDSLVSMTSSLIKKCLEEAKNDRESIDKNEYEKRLTEIRNMNEYKEVSCELSIEDFRKIKKPSIKVIENTKNEISKITMSSYERIRYFCDRMEYLGIINEKFMSSDMPENKSQEYIIMDYYGYNIINSYNVLKPFIEIAQKEKKGNAYYHYSLLYMSAVKRESAFRQEMKKRIESFNLSQ